MTSGIRAAALAHFDRKRARHLDDLKKLVSIPSISFPGFDAAPVRSCADAVASLMRSSGLEGVQVLGTGAGYPSVFGQRSGPAGAPTLLLYAHSDVQPVGRAGHWTTPPFEPSVRDGRLYGRGTADDKGGLMMHLAAAASWSCRHRIAPGESQGPDRL